MFRLQEGRVPKGLILTLAIFFLSEFVLFVVFSCYMSRNNPNSLLNDCLSVNGTTSDVLTNLSALPSFQNCSRGITLGNEIFIHVCWYQREVLVDIRKFNRNRPDILGIGLKKENWYKAVDEMNFITELIKDTEFNHTIFGYTDWL